MRYLFAPYPFVRYTILLIVGILVANYYPIYRPINFLYASLLLALVYLILFIWKAQNARFLLGIIGLFFTGILGYYIGIKALNTANTDKLVVETLPAFFKIKVNNLPEEKANAWKVKAIIEATHTEILLYLKKELYAKPQYGNIYYLKAKPTEIPSPKNPYEFDYKLYLSYQGIHYQCFVYNRNAILIGNKPESILLNFAYNINQYCDAIFSKYFKNKQNLAVINAMVLGLRDDIDHDLLQAYSAAGAIHVLSVSGLHVGVIMVVLVGAFGFLRKRGKWGKATFLALILTILWLYALLTGMSAPVLRSTFMFSIILLAQTISVRSNSLNTLAISSFFILLFYPLLLFTVGFLLSYLAVLGMILIQPMLNRLWEIDKHKNWMYWLLDRLWKISTVAVSAQIATLPITIYLFHQFPNYFLLANPIVIVLSSFTLIGGLAYLVLAPMLEFFALTKILSACTWLVEGSVYLLNKTVLFTEKVPGAISNFLNFSTAEMILLYLLIISMLAVFSQQKYSYVRVSIGCVVLLFCLNIYQFFSAKNQNLLLVHSVPKAVVLSHTIGRQSTVYANAEFLNDNKNLSFRLNNLWANMAIIDTNSVLIGSENQILKLKEKTILILNKKLHKNSPQITVDYLLVNNKRLQFDNDVAGQFRAKYILLTGNFTEFYKNRFVKAAKIKGQYVYSLLDEKALEI